MNKLFENYNLTINFINPEIKPIVHSNVSRDNVHWGDHYLIVTVTNKNIRYPWATMAYLEQEGID